jgi:hypothetical protein
MCVLGTLSPGFVKIRALGTLMAAFVMLNVLDFGNCGHIVIMATCVQIVGANHRHSSPATNSERNRVAMVYRCPLCLRFSCFNLHTRTMACRWHIFSPIIRNFVILTHIFVMYCSPGANQSVYRAYVCIRSYLRCLCQGFKPRGANMAICAH